MKMPMNMIGTPDRDITMALAGIFQSATLVYQIAKMDQYDERALHQSIYSLIRLDAHDVEEVYGTVSGVALGLRTIISLFTNASDQSTKDVYQYAVAVHQLSIKLSKRPKTGETIRNELDVIRSQFTQRQDVEMESDALHQALADLYTATISYLTPRIIVQGASEILQQPKTVNRVRSALFSGIRAAYLWHQLGGRRWQLVINRKEYVQMARNLLA